jgi:hypothetical protein
MSEALETLARLPLVDAFKSLTQFFSMHIPTDPEGDLLEPTGSVHASPLYTSRCLEILFHSIIAGNSVESGDLSLLLREFLFKALLCGLEVSTESPLISAIDEAVNTATQNILTLRTTLEAAGSASSATGGLNASELALPLSISCAKLFISYRKAICVLNKKALLDDNERQALSDLINAEAHAKAGMPMRPSPPVQSSSTLSPRGNRGGGATATAAATTHAAMVDMTALVEFYSQAHSVVQSLGEVDYNEPNGGSEKVIHSAIEVIQDAARSTTPLVTSVVSKIQSAMPQSSSRDSHHTSPEIAVKKANDELVLRRQNLSAAVMPVKNRYLASKERRLALEAEKAVLMAKMAAVEEELDSVMTTETLSDEKLREVLLIHQPLVEEATRKVQHAEEAAVKINAAPFVSKAVESVSSSFTLTVKNAASAIDAIKKAKDKAVVSSGTIIASPSPTSPSPYLRAMIAYLKLQALLLVNLSRRASLNRLQAEQLVETEKQLMQLGGMVREAKEARDKAKDAKEKAIQDEETIISLKQQSSHLVRSGVKTRYSPSILATFQRMSPLDQVTLHVIRALATGLGLDTDLREVGDGNSGTGGWEMFPLPSSVDPALVAEVASARQCLKSAVSIPNVSSHASVPSAVSVSAPTTATTVPASPASTQGKGNTLPLSPAPSTVAPFVVPSLSLSTTSGGVDSPSQAKNSPRRMTPSASKEKKEAGGKGTGGGPIIVDKRTGSSREGGGGGGGGGASIGAVVDKRTTTITTTNTVSINSGGVSIGSAKKSPWGAIASSPLRVPFPKESDVIDGSSWGDQVLDEDKKNKSNAAATAK